MLERLSGGRGPPAIIQTDNGPEFTGRVLDQWAFERGVKLRFIAPGKPIQNAFVESFNSRPREERRNEHVFVSPGDARNKIEKRRIEYHRERPHSSLGRLTPEEFVAKNQRSSAGAAQCAPASNPKPDRFSTALRE